MGSVSVLENYESINKLSLVEEHEDDPRVGWCFALNRTTQDWDLIYVRTKKKHFFAISDEKYRKGIVELLDAVPFSELIACDRPVNETPDPSYDWWVLRLGLRDGRTLAFNCGTERGPLEAYGFIQTRTGLGGDAGAQSAAAAPAVAAAPRPTSCLNCGAPATGSFCTYCGSPIH